MKTDLINKTIRSMLHPKLLMKHGFNWMHTWENYSFHVIIAHKGRIRWSQELEQEDRNSYVFRFSMGLGSYGFKFKNCTFSGQFITGNWQSSAALRHRMSRNHHYNTDRGKQESAEAIWRERFPCEEENTHARNQRSNKTSSAHIWSCII